MVIKRTSYAVYDTRYHLVWAPKYQKWILRRDFREFGETVFKEFATANDFEIEAMEIAEDHVHVFLGFFHLGIRSLKYYNDLRGDLFFKFSGM